jgi:hypothetical protein
MSVLDIQHEVGYDEIEDEIADDVMKQFDLWQEAIDDMGEKGMLDLWEQGDFDQELSDWIDRWMDGGSGDCFEYYDEMMAMWKDEFFPAYRNKIAEWFKMCREGDWTDKEIVDELGVFFKVK